MVESMMLSGYFFTNTSRRDFFEIDLCTREDTRFGRGASSMYYLKPPVPAAKPTVQPHIELPPGTYRITDTDDKLHDLLTSMRAVIPGVTRMAKAFMPLKNAPATLTATFVDGEVPTLRIRLTTCLGNTCWDMFSVYGEKKRQLVDLLS